LTPNLCSHPTSHWTPSPVHSLFFFSLSGDHRHLHSFPTRRSSDLSEYHWHQWGVPRQLLHRLHSPFPHPSPRFFLWLRQQRKKLDRKSTRLNSSHVKISYAVFCLKKKKKRETLEGTQTKRIAAKRG